MKFNKYFYLLILAIFIFGLPILVFSEDVGGNKSEIDQLNQQIKERKDKIKQLEASIEEYKKKITQKKLESQSLKNQMAILDNYIAQVQLDIDKTEEILKTTELEIQSITLSIDDKEKVIDKQKKIMADLIRSIYENDGKSYIEIAATHDNFSDFYGKIQNLKTIDNELGKNVVAIKIIKTDLENKKALSEEKKKSYIELNDKLAQRKNDLREDVSVKEDLLIETKSSELVYSTMLTNLKKQYQEIEGEIVSIEREVRKSLEKQNKINDNPDTSDGSFAWPVPSHYVTAQFYDPDYPYRNVFEHTGLDIRASQGTAVHAAGSGYIARAKKCSTASCYSYIMIVHNGGLSTVYGHLSGIAVSEDQFVTKGDVIGYSGGTRGSVGAGPFVTGPHLHFEVRKDGIPTNPTKYLE